MKSQIQFMRRNSWRTMLVLLVCWMQLESISQAQTQPKAQTPRATRTTSIARTVAPTYQLGAGDILSVTVARHPEMSVEEVPVNAAGRISLPVVGGLNVAGKTVDQVTREVRQRLTVALRRPEVTITLKQARAQTVSVLGAVERPGIYEIKSGWRVLDAIAAAGGVTARPELAYLTLSSVNSGSSGATNTRTANSRARTSLSVELNTLLNDPADASNKRLQPGDTLRIASRTVQVSIAGQVKTPGSYTLPLASTVLDVLALSGGANPTAALSRATLKRRGDSNAQTLDLLAMMSQPEATAPRLSEGDLIIVPESRAAFSVLGAVQKPGSFPLAERSALRVSEAIALAGGFIGSADKSSVVLSRRENDQMRSQTLSGNALLDGTDALANDLVRDGDVISVATVSRKVTISGEVKTPGAYEVKSGDSVPQLIALAGGNLESAALSRIAVQRNGQSLPVDAYRALKEGVPLEFPLLDGDFVIVPRNDARVLVLGAVERPGSVTIGEKTVLRLGEAIGLAGGAKDRAKVKEIGVFRNTPNGVTRQVISLEKVTDGQLGLNVPLQNGDTLYVPEGRQSNTFWDQLGRVLPFVGLFN